MSQPSSESIGPPARRGAASERERRNWADLRALVRHFWTQGVSQQLLHERLWRELGLVERPDTLADPARLMVSLPGQAPRPLCPGESIRDIFADGGERLLILGAPGSGKTTTLLALAGALLDAADADETLPIPVIFPLASWAARRPPLHRWLVEELARSYKVPSPLGKAWVEAGVILPLLDGLDEVGPTDAERAACLEAISAYLGRYGGPAVVCGRTAEYERQGRSLPIEVAVELQPLAAAQVDAYLARLGPALAGLREAVARDAGLRELAASPLLLNVMGLAYRDQPADAFVGRGRDDAERRLWADFAARRLALPRDGASADSEQLRTWLKAKRQALGGDARTSADPEQLRAWLIWLARGMAAHSQQVFLIEYLEPGWLATRGQRRLFSWLSNLGFALIATLLGVLLSGLLGGLLGSLAAGLLLLLVGVLGGGFVTGMLFDRRGALPGQVPRGTWRRLFDRSRLWDSTRKTLAVTVGVVLVGVLLCGLLRVLVGEPLDILVGALAARPDVVLRIALVVVLLAVLGGGAADVLRQEGEIFVRVDPDQGVSRSRRAMVVGGLRRGLTSGLITVVAFGLQTGLVVGLIAGLVVGLIAGLFGGFISRLISGLTYGSSALLKHIVLRWLLHRRCRAPWDFAAALDEAVSRALMHRIGGGYCFSHRLLQEHFAQHEQPALPIAPILGPDGEA